jgi:VWFA-related protein
MMLYVLSTLFVGFSQTLKTPSTATDPYTLNVAVDEVSLTFHAADFHGIPMDDLKLSELRLLDNGKHPRQIISFEAHQNLPVRFGILMDTSRSMLEDLRRNRAIANEYLAQLLRKQTDSAFLMRFDSDSKVLQDWTGDSDALSATLRNVSSDHESRLGGHCTLRLDLQGLPRSVRN